jgi:hypothetical protein
MATLTPLNGWDEAGLAGQSSDIINAEPDPLLMGDTPKYFTQDLEVADSQTLAARTVVGFSAGKIAEANNTTVTAIGVLMHDVATGVGEGKFAKVIRGGHLNMDLLIWNAAYSTDALKFAAFEGAASPTQILVRRPKTMTVPAPA